jgi:geranylgeranyl pyrophosphate synthase
MALAYQSAAIMCLAQADMSGSQRASASIALARAALATSAGQHLDVQNLRGEESYWTVVEAKSTPFYGAAFEIGAILGSASDHVARDMNSLGVIIGEIIQIEDDLDDALEVPANADWKMGRNNLLLLYAQTAEFEERERFVHLCTRTDEPTALAEAQRILITCGAVSYAAYQLVSRYRKAKKLLTGISLKDPSVLHHILDEYANSLFSLLKQSEVEISMESLMDH